MGSGWRLAGAEAHAESTPGLGEGDVETQDAGAVLALEDDEMTAGVEHGHGQRGEVLPAASARAVSVIILAASRPILVMGALPCFAGAGGRRMAGVEGKLRLRGVPVNCALAGVSQPVPQAVDGLPAAYQHRLVE